jgi:hypothetical protein
MTSDVCWTVDAWSADLGWTEWAAWVDRATAEAERANAREQGHFARIRRAS